MNSKKEWYWEQIKRMCTWCGKGRNSQIHHRYRLPANVMAYCKMFRSFLNPPPLSLSLSHTPSQQWKTLARISRFFGFGILTCLWYTTGFETHTAALFSEPTGVPSAVVEQLAPNPQSSGHRDTKKTSSRPFFLAVSKIPT
jgi:hypothetical protein